MSEVEQPNKILHLMESMYLKLQQYNLIDDAMEQNYREIHDNYLDVILQELDQTITTKCETKKEE
jgi:hypothetical protein